MKKTIIVVVSIVLVLSLIGVGVYYFLDNYIFYPEITEALEKTLKNKVGNLSAFDTEGYVEGGKTEIAFDLGDSDTKGKISISHDEDTVFATVDCLDEKFSLGIEKDKIAINSENFQNGKFYGINMDDAVSRLDNSIFAPNSGTDYRINQEDFENIKKMLSSPGEDKTDSIKLLFSSFVDVVKNSDIAKTFSMENKTVNVLGEPRKCKTQSLSIDKNSLADFLTKLSNKLQNLTDDEIEALKDVYSPLVTGSVDFEKFVDELSDEVDEAAKDLRDASDENDFLLDITICYNKKAVSAILFNLNQTTVSDYDDYNETVKSINNLELDFGEDPTENRKVVLGIETKTTLYNSSDEVKFESYQNINAVLDSKKVNGIINYDFSVSSDSYRVQDDEKTENHDDNVLSFTLELDTNADKGKIEIKDNVSGFTVFNFEYIDEKDKVSIKPISVEDNYGENIFPYDITLTLYNTPDKFSFDVEEDIIDFSVDEMNSFMDSLEEYFNSVEDKFESFFGEFENGFEEIEYSY